MQLRPRSSVGKKIVMAITGQFMVLFIVIHVIGNFTIYFDWLNAYAEKLHALPVLLWLFRTSMIVVFSVHVFLGIVLKLENRSAKPQSYAIKKRLSTTFASENMIWTGVVIASFIIYHLLHFTIQVINPEISAGANSDAMGRPDVFSMVVLNFQDVFISLTYIFAMIALVLHLSHGIQSSFQTLGLNNEITQPAMTRAGSVAAYLLFIAYISIPIVIVLGLLRG